MKYIRAKDVFDGERIYVNDVPEPKNEHEKEILQKLRDNIGEIIISEADTIEGLCDEFVQINKSKDKDLVRIKKIDGVIYYQKLERVFDSEWHKLSSNEYIIGAIWTDKGLIYVAKMNEKGELELL